MEMTRCDKCDKMHDSKLIKNVDSFNFCVWCKPELFDNKTELTTEYDEYSKLEFKTLEEVKAFMQEAKHEGIKDFFDDMNNRYIEKIIQYKGRYYRVCYCNDEIVKEGNKYIFFEVEKKEKVIIEWVEVIKKDVDSISKKDNKISFGIKNPNSEIKITFKDKWEMTKCSIEGHDYVYRHEKFALQVYIDSYVYDREENVDIYCKLDNGTNFGMRIEENHFIESIKWVQKMLEQYGIIVDILSSIELIKRS